MKKFVLIILLLTLVLVIYYVFVIRKKITITKVDLSQKQIELNLGGRKFIINENESVTKDDQTFAVTPKNAAGTVIYYFTINKGGKEVYNKVLQELKEGEIKL